MSANAIDWVQWTGATPLAQSAFGCCAYTMNKRTKATGHTVFITFIVNCLWFIALRARFPSFLVLLLISYRHIQEETLDFCSLQFSFLLLNSLFALILTNTIYWTTSNFLHVIILLTTGHMQSIVYWERKWHADKQNNNNKTKWNKN